MDWQSVCIIDNKDGRDITERVVSIEKDCSISRYRVVFDNSPKEFQYGFNRITYHDDPVQVNVKDKLFFSKGKLQPEIKTILVFGEWCKIQYFDDVISTVPFTNLQYVRDKRSEKSISNIMDYLIEVSSIDDSRGLLSEEEPSFLETQLKSMPVREDSALYAFFNSDEPAPCIISGPIIAPFSSNKSQIDAIKNALQNNLSVIQGPPGTGKTQTILNIIANLIIRGYKIAVVSGNNEATRNVYEKLDNEKLGSLCATLGNKANIAAFFEKQPSKKDLKKLVEASDKSLNDNDMNRLESIVGKLYAAVIERAKLQAKISELRIEEQSNRFASIEYQLPEKSRLSGNLSSKQCLEYSAFIETLYSKKSWRFIKNLKMYGRFHFWPKNSFSPSRLVDYLQLRYYREKETELKQQIDDIDAKYPEEKKQQILGLFKRESLKKLYCELNKQYKNLEECIFDSEAKRRNERQNSSWSRSETN